MVEPKTPRRLNAAALKRLREYGCIGMSQGGYLVENVRARSHVDGSVTITLKVRDRDNWEADS